MRARRAEAEQLRAELVELDAAGGEGDPPFEYLTRCFGFFYVDTLGRWLDEVEQGLLLSPPAATSQQAAPAD